MSAKPSISLTAIFLCVTVLLCALLGAGCGQSKPKVMVFMGKSSKSYDAMKSTIDNLKKKYKNKVTFVIVDYDDPASNGQIKKYSVSMNPTVIIFNSKGEIKETFMGAAREEMLAARIDGMLPSGGTSTPSQPGSTTAPVVSVPVTTAP